VWIYTQSNITQAFSKLVDNLGQAVRTQPDYDLLADLLQDVRFLRVYKKHMLDHKMLYWSGNLCYVYWFALYGIGFCFVP
jgi:hypothetical protein